MEITPFDFDGQQVRVLADENGEPRFVLADLCRVLGIGNARDVTARLDADMKGVDQIDTPGGRQSMTTVTEAGMYEVVIRSDKPQAVAFRRWITSEVLPAIRKHGMYATPAAVEQMLGDPDAMITALTALKEERAAKERALAYAAELEPAAEAWSEVMDADGTYDFNTVAKMLGTGRVRLMAQLRADKVLTRENLPMQSHVECGRFTVKVGRPWEKPDGTSHVSRSCRVTAKGLDWLASRYGNGGTQYELQAVGW